MNVSPGLISTIWWFIAVWLAWKSMEWLIWPWFVRCTLTVSPRCTRMTGPGTVPPNVQACTTKPSATVMSFSMIGKSTSWTVPAITAGAVGSLRTYGGAFGSATGAAAAAGAGVASPMPAIGDAGAAAAAVAAGAGVATLATVCPPPGVPPPVAKDQAGFSALAQPAVTRASSAAVATRRWVRFMARPFPCGPGLFPSRVLPTAPGLPWSEWSRGGCCNYQ